MEKVRFIGILLFFIETAASQGLFPQTIPPAREVGFCTCQQRPFLRGRMPRNHGVEFWLFTRSSVGDEGTSIKLGNDASIQNSGFAPTLPLTVVTHGWTEGTTRTNWIYPMKDALLSQANMNVILVDWSRLAGQNYATSARNTKHTGLLIAEFLHFIKRNFPQFTSAKVHLIGFSMGAHVSGIAGHHFPGIARITGLDPAGPAFECIDLSERLDPSDAAFVDIVHTNAGCYSQGHIGYRTPTGHQDFYVNGGGSQPNCASFFSDAFANFVTARNPYVCHHHRSIEYFQESIYAQEIPYGYFCSDYETFQSGACLNTGKAVFGYHAKPMNVQGVQRPLTFFLSTQDESTFLSKHVKIDVHLGTNGDSVARGDLILAVNGRNGQPQLITLLKNGRRLGPNLLLRGMMVFPLNSDISSMNFVITYESQGLQLTVFNYFLDVLKIVAVDTSTGQEYCVLPREAIKISRRIIRNPRMDSC